VVYKVDRLTRSLADFAKLVELFDQHAVSFVSVTQSFNTTSSMASALPLKGRGFRHGPADKGAMAALGTSRRFAAAQQIGAIGGEADSSRITASDIKGATDCDRVGLFDNA
jgi:hypothetical protein